MTIREWRPDDRIGDLTRLVNASYATLADQGLRFLGTYQNDEITADPASRAQVWVAESPAGELVGTISLEDRSQSPEQNEQFYVSSQTRIISQFCVLQEMRGQGLGDELLAFAERQAAAAGATQVMLDTALPASNLRGYYARHGFHERHEVQWDGPNYRSVVMVKNLAAGPVLRLATDADSSGVVRVIRDCFDVHGFTWDEADYCRDLYALESSYERPQAYFWVAEVEGEILGTAALSLHAQVSGQLGLIPDPRPGQTRIGGTDCELHRLYVHPDSQGQGLGRALLRVVRDQALADGASEMEIWSDVKLATAHGIYKRLGAIHQGDRILDDPDDSNEHGFSLNLTETVGQL
ncbi:MAG: GNAT family N-acetyltransferase [Chthonomonas sp.]|nr:GNAT family N-acetyltransferase [Chthonomonas sp.]